jgi:hypothetical protein
MPGRAKLRAGPRPRAGGFTFAEVPERSAPEARIIWCASLDPGTLKVAAHPTHRGDPDGVRLAEFAHWLTVATGPAGTEHAALSDGWRRIRLDVEAGNLSNHETILLRYRLQGTLSADLRVLSLRRLLHLLRHRRFARTLFPRDPRMARWLTVLRVHDALMDGASQREIGKALYGETRIEHGWEGQSDSLRSRVRRLVGEARTMAQGAYRQLLGAGADERIS